MERGTPSEMPPSAELPSAESPGAESASAAPSSAQSLSAQAPSALLTDVPAPAAPTAARTDAQVGDSSAAEQVEVTAVSAPTARVTASADLPAAKRVSEPPQAHVDYKEVRRAKAAAGELVLRDRRRTLAAMAFVGVLLGGGFGLIRALTALPATPGDARAIDAATAPDARGIESARAAALPAQALLADGGALLVRAEPPRVPRLRDAVGADAELSTHTMGRRVFGTALAKAAVSPKELAELTQCFKGVHSFDRTRPHDEFHVLRDRSSHALLGFEYESGTDLFQARQVAGTLACSHVVLTLEYVHHAGVLVLAGDVKEAATQAGFDASIADLLDDALDGHVDLDHAHAGARIRVVALEQRANGGFSAYQAVLGLEYLPASKQRPPLRIYGFSSGSRQRSTQPSKPTYYDSKAEKVFHGAFSMPIPFARVTSKFNPRRMHPVLHTIMPHNGVDYGGSTGTPVYAVAAGILKFAADSGPCGNMVQVEHPAALLSSYCHLSRFAPGLHVGQKIERKQLVGYVGQTGRVTGPHLHFAVKRDGKFIDPLSLKLGGMMRLGKADKSRFDLDKAAIDQELEAIALPASGDAAGGEDAPESAAESTDESESADP